MVSITRSRRLQATVTALGGLVLCLLAVGARPAGAQVLPRTAGPDASAPVYDGDAPDPDVIRVGSTYYAYTTGSDLVNVPVLSSSDLQSWTPVGDALPDVAVVVGAGPHVVARCRLPRRAVRHVLRDRGGGYR